MIQFKDDIRIRQRHRQTRVHWAHVWFVVIGILIVLAAFILGYFYISLAPMRQAENRVQKLVRDKTSIATVTQVSVDYRKTTTYAVLGQTASGTEKVAIVRHNKVKTYNRSEGMSDSQLKKIITKKYKPKKLYSANISEYQGVLVWEISYKGADSKLNYLTLDFKTGKAYRAISGM
ncbi:hypothetical protein GCM10025879_18260 [Leuconostoc litchii]|uniref:Cell wall elongation regulator TseB-like domain-containing protein n=1 Tax=Leuconostoc litchii TaxID=1981069 RepID=A0A6P2CNM6_9LACO|nr:DUF5590 domain-containing protein [Leuconostoc litchii]TYC46702.1 hypothetical protein ESZ47_00765 [Leuconostoc litchii]GMA70580.1 hypothetical protein GCM10025879_18260 [Leuconostoc litchii]